METPESDQIYLPDNIIFDIKHKSISAESKHVHLVHWALCCAAHYTVTCKLLSVYNTKKQRSQATEAV